MILRQRAEEKLVKTKGAKTKPKSQDRNQTMFVRVYIYINALREL